MSGKPPLPKVFVRQQVKERIISIRSYIDNQRGNDPQDIISRRIQKAILNDLDYVRQWPWVGQAIAGMEQNWRHYRIAKTYILYYYITTDGTEIYFIDLRHTSQKPLRPSTIRKHKNEIPE